MSITVEALHKLIKNAFDKREEYQKQKKIAEE